MTYRKKYLKLKKAVRSFIEIEARIFNSSKVPYRYDDMDKARRLLSKLCAGTSDVERAALRIRKTMTVPEFKRIRIRRKA